MNRKLHNSLTALMASAAVLVLGLVAATPAAPSGNEVGTQPITYEAPAPASGFDQLTAVARAEAAATVIRADLSEIDTLADAAALTAELAAAAALAAAFQQASSAPQDSGDQVPSHPPRKTTRRNRQTLVMPFFSFAPRG
ncbi:hypothetical protein [Lysobacter sp. D1-1-M9]|uniref:hypothetical protein n=1 Tax=Novilysobacter longmucuonensis TaxID=3098603 RepID=UPI002FC77A06